MTSSADLAKLLRKTHLDSHDEVLAAAEVALGKSKGDVVAQHTRVVALFNLDRYKDAVQVFEEPGAEQLKKVATLEYAYALNKVGKLKEALDVAKVVDSKDGMKRGLKHLAAQANYKLENFETAAKLYEDLERDDPQAVNEANDLRINGLAINAQLEWKGLGHLVKSRKTQKEDLEAFETAYNAACGCIARGELRQAEILLNRSKELCSTADDLSEEVKKAELLPILVQQIYVLSKQGKVEDAKSLCQSLPLEPDSDPLTKYLALNNTLAVSPPDNPFVTQRILKSASRPSKGDAPFDNQTVILNQNTYAVDLLAHKYPGVAKSTGTKLKAASTQSIDPKLTTLSVLNAAAHVRNETGNRAIKSMLPLLEKRPSDIGLVLTVIQLYVLTNNVSAAITLLESFFKRLDQAGDGKSRSTRFAPGLVSVAGSLYTSQGRIAAAKSLLIDAANHWKTNSSSSSTMLLRAAGSRLLLDPAVTKDDAETAVSIFEDLHAANKKDRLASAGLVAARCIAAGPYGKIDESHVESLTPTEKLIGNINAAELEAAGIYVPPASQQTVGKRKRLADAEEDTKKHDQKAHAQKKRKLSAKRKPKEYVEGKAVDPERWLPMKDRSYWRPKGKKGKARAAGLTQGGIVDEKTEAKTSAHSAPSGGSGGAGKNKKKKGKKW